MGAVELQRGCEGITAVHLPDHNRVLLLAQPLPNPPQFTDQLRRVFDGIHAIRRIRRVARFALHITTHRELALVAEHRFQLGRLADDAQHRFYRALFQYLEQRTHAQAAGFLVVRQGDVHRQAQVCLDQRGHQRQHAGDVTLHIRRAPAKQLAVALGQLERRHCPRLPIHRHHIGMARQHNARQFHRADAGEQVGLAAFLVVDQLTGYAVTRQVIARTLDQLQVGFAAGGVKPHQRLQPLAAAAHRSSPATP